MTITIRREVPNVMYSLLYWLRNYAYAGSNIENGAASTGMLTDFFAELDIKAAYPDDLTKLTRPTLALGAPEIAQGRAYYGGNVDVNVQAQDIIPVSLFGFVVGRGDFQRSARYRDALMNDVYQLLAQVATDEGFTLYDAASKAAIGSVEVNNVRARLIPSNVPAVEADRYRFVVTAEADYD